MLGLCECADRTGCHRSGGPSVVQCGSNDAAISAQHSTVDSGTVGASEEGDGICDIFRLAEPLQRSELGEPVDYFLRLAVEE
jgi:hypothetical protein